MNASSREEPRNPLGPEFELIEHLAARLPAGELLPAEAREALLLGVGDDAAVWRLPSGLAGIFTLDTLVEGVHAWPHEPPEDVGARALTAAASDIAAMGGDPHLALVALQAPQGEGEARLLRMYDGIALEAGLLALAVVGGDVVDTPGPLALVVAVFGTAEAAALWTRSGAQPGDLLAVTGDLGGSRAGLELLNPKIEHKLNKPWAENLKNRHLRPHARTTAARRLREVPGVHAAVDISDGLSSEAWHLALASGVCVRLEAAAIPLHPDLGAYLEWRSGGGGAGREGRGEAVAYAADSGEEYELLLAIAPDHPAVREGSTGPEGSFAAETGVALTVVGAVEEGPAAVRLVEAGGDRPIEPGGHTHRRPDRGRG